MVDYKEMYFNLAASVADAIELLTRAQQAGEDAYADSIDKPPISLAHKATGTEHKNNP